MTATKRKTTPIVERDLVMSRDLADLLSDALLFADRSGYMPALDAVLLDVKDGRITAVATDRYVLGIRTMAWSGPDLSNFLLDGTDAADLVTLLRARSPRSSSGVPVELALMDGALVATVGNVTLRCNAKEAEFPKYQSLLEKAKTREATPDAGTIGVNRKLLAKFARLSSKDPMHMVSSGSLNPIQVRVGAEFIGILMPVRMADYSNEVAAA